MSAYHLATYVCMQSTYLWVHTIYLPMCTYHLPTYVFMPSIYLWCHTIHIPMHACHLLTNVFVSSFDIPKSKPSNTFWNSSWFNLPSLFWSIRAYACFNSFRFSSLSFGEILGLQNKKIKLFFNFIKSLKKLKLFYH